MAQRQIVELVRVLATEPRVVILDEPTAALPDRQVEWLSGHMRRLRDAGSCVIFTSHRWREIEALADRVTVFRNGTQVATRDRISEAEAVTLMSGRTFEGTYPDVTTIARGASALRVSDLHGGRLRGVSFDLRRGEILGVGGLAGQGQRDLFLTLFGAQRSAGRHAERGWRGGHSPPAQGRDPGRARHRLRAGGPQGRGAVPAAVHSRQHRAGDPVAPVGRRLRPAGS